MSDHRPLLSIVCPAFNEEDVLPLFHPVLVEALEPLGRDYRIEIIYSDDGSRDRTLDAIRQIAAGDERVSYVSLSRNFGHQAALTAGLEQAAGDAVVMLDSDLQHPPRLIPKLVEFWRSGFDVVQTIRADDERLGWLKRKSSSVFYRLLRRWSTIDVRPAASDFRLMSRRSLDALLRLRESHRFLRGMVQWLGYPTAEVPFEPDERRAGKSKYTVRKMLRLALDGLFSFSRAPLRLPIVLGFGVAAVSLITTIVFALVRHADPLFIGVMFGLHGIGVCVLLALASIGEYVGRIHEESKGRPLYVCKTESNRELQSQPRRAA